MGLDVFVIHLDDDEVQLNLDVLIGRESLRLNERVDRLFPPYQFVLALHFLLEDEKLIPVLRNDFEVGLFLLCLNEGLELGLRGGVLDELIQVLFPPHDLPQIRQLLQVFLDVLAKILDDFNVEELDRGLDLSHQKLSLGKLVLDVAHFAQINLIRRKLVDLDDLHGLHFQ